MFTSLGNGSHQPAMTAMTAGYRGAIRATPSPRRVPRHHAEESRHWPRTHRNECHLGRAKKSPKISEKNIGRYGKIPYLWRVFLGKIMGNTATLQEVANFNGFLLVYNWAKCWVYGGYIEVVDGLNINQQTSLP